MKVFSGWMRMADDDAVGRLRTRSLFFDKPGERWMTYKCMCSNSDMHVLIRESFDAHLSSLS